MTRSGRLDAKASNRFDPVMCNNYEQHVTWRAYREMMRQLEWGVPTHQSEADLLQADDIHISDLGVCSKVRFSRSRTGPSTLIQVFAHEEEASCADRFLSRSITRAAPAPKRLSPPDRAGLSVARSNKAKAK